MADDQSPKIPVRFPAFSFSHGLLYVVDSPLLVCTRLGYKSDYFKNLVLIDSQGHKFRATGARIVKRLPFRFTFGEFLGLLSWNPRYQVELIFTPKVTEVSVDEVKKLIFKSFAKEKDSWEEMCDFEEFSQRVAAAQSFDGIFAAFREFNQA